MVFRTIGASYQWDFGLSLDNPKMAAQPRGGTKANTVRVFTATSRAIYSCIPRKSTGRQVSGVVKSHFVSRNWKFRRRNSISSTKLNFVDEFQFRVHEIEFRLTKLKSSCLHITFVYEIEFRVRNSISCTRN